MERRIAAARSKRNPHTAAYYVKGEGEECVVVCKTHDSERTVNEIKTAYGVEPQKLAHPPTMVKCMQKNPDGSLSPAPRGVDSKDPKYVRVVYKNSSREL